MAFDLEAIKDKANANVERGHTKVLRYIDSEKFEDDLQEILEYMAERTTIIPVTIESTRYTNEPREFYIKIGNKDVYYVQDPPFDSRRSVIDTYNRMIERLRGLGLGINDYAEPYLSEDKYCYSGLFDIVVR